MLKFLKGLNQNISVVSNDAGAANIILHWVKLYNFQNLDFCVDGPALEIFSKEFPNFKNNHFDYIVKKNKILLSGTSWSSPLEHNARKLASYNNIYSIAVIDHWVNYKKRFQFNDEYILPNEIWVTDLVSFHIAKDTFLDIKVRMLPNFYEKYQVKKIKLEKKLNERVFKKSEDVLYILEPIRDIWDEKSNIKGEFQALEFFIKNLKLLNLNKNCNIILRLHPSEKKGKYNNWIKMKKGYRIQTSDLRTTLYDDIAKADWVVGCNSYALVIALKAKIKVASTLPPHAPDCVLPFPNILKMKDKII